MFNFIVRSPEAGTLVVTSDPTYPDPASATDPVNADVYWRRASEGFVSNRHLGTFRVGSDVDFDLPLAEDTDVVFTTVTRGPRGQRMYLDPSEAPQTVVRIPGIGGGSGTSLLIAEEGTLLPARGTLNFIGSAVTAADNAASGRTDVTVTAGNPNYANQNLGVAPRSETNLPLPFIRADDVAGRTWLQLQRVETGCYNAITDLNCSGDPRYYQANFSAGVPSVTIIPGAFWDTGTIGTLPPAYWHEGTVHTFRQGQGVRLQWAPGADYLTTITSVSGNVLGLAAAPPANAAPGLICHDETAAIQAALNMKRRIHFPTGRYLVYSELRFPQTLSGFYDGLELTGDGERNSIILCGHDGHGFRMDGAGGGLVHLRMRNLGILACERGNKDALPTTNYGAALAFTCTTLNADGVPEGDTTDFRLDHLFLQGFAYGILSQNTQTGYLGHITVWYHINAGIALVGNNNDVGTSQKETNAVQIYDSFMQYGRFVQDATYTTTASIGARARTLSLPGLPSTPRSRKGAIIKINGAGVGGRAHITFIENISGATVTISMPTYTASSAASNVTVYPTNVGNVYLQNANNVDLLGGTHQGNWAHRSSIGADPDFGAAINEVCGVRAEALTSLRIDSLWYEDVGGEQGASIDLYNTRGVFISGCHIGGAKKSSPDLPSGHGVGVRLQDCDGTRLEGCYFGQSGTGTWLQLNNTTFGRTRGTVVGSSMIPGPEQYNNTGLQCEPVILEDSCIMPAALDLNRGTLSLVDDQWGQYLKNPRFIDRSGSNPADWTVVNAAFAFTPTSAPTAWLDRWDAYITVNTQGQAAAGEGEVLTQTVSLPDSDEARAWTLSFDARMTTRGAGGGTNDFQSVSITATPGGVDSSQYFQLSGATSIGFFLNRWQRYQLRCRVPAGAGRTLKVAISATRGTNTPIVQYANFRLQRGRAGTHDADGVVSERGGVVRAPLELAAVTSPPVSATGRVSLANIGGALSVSSNGAAYAPVGGSSGANIQLSNLSINAGNSFNSNVALNAWLFPAVDAYTAAAAGQLTSVGLGKADKLLDAIYCQNGVFVYPILSSTLGPKAFGFMGGHPTTRGEFAANEATRFLLLKDRNVIQTAYTGRTQISSYHGIEIRGNRRSNVAPAYSEPGGGNDNLNTVIYSETNCLGLIVDSVPGAVLSPTPLVSFRRSNVELARVGWSGELRFAASFEPGVVKCDAARPTIFEYEPFTYYRVDTTTGLRTIRLPSPSDIGSPRLIWFYKANDGGGALQIVIIGGGTVEAPVAGALWDIPGTQPHKLFWLVGIPDQTNFVSGAYRGTWYFGQE